jgi:hypothetical protein
MKKNLLLLFVLLSGLANSQITLQHSDFQSAFSIGTVYLSYSTPIGGDQFEVFVGEPSSSPQIWDLTALPMEYLGISQSIQPSAAPFIGDFPTSDLVLYEKYWLSPGDTLYTWNYKELNSDRLLLHGLSGEDALYLIYDPPAVQSKIPMTFGTTWIKEWDSAYYMPDVYVITESEMIVDAFGTLKVTTGEFPCLRVRQDQRTISHTPVGSDTAMTRSFNLYTQGMIEVNFGSINEDQFDLPTIWTSGVKLSGRPGSVGLPVINPPNSGALLTGIFPNPVSEIAEIKYTLKDYTRVNLMVIDLSGREVTEVFNGYQNAGDHKASINVSGIPAGIYFCRIRADRETETRKIVVCR